MLKMKLNKYILEITVFVCGAVVMVFELIGSRILGPYLGTSTFVWTSLIGVILGSLSFGYYLGGKIADKKSNIRTLSIIIFLSAILIGLTALTKDYWLIAFQSIWENAKIVSIITSIILFSPASICLGMISPYVVKLKINSLNTSASTVGNLYAISTIGSIAGTFLAGFYLIPHFGTNKLLIILIITLIFVSLITSFRELKKIKLFFLIIAIIVLVVAPKYELTLLKEIGFLNFIDIDTAYNRVWVYDRLDKKTNRYVKIMGINNENHSGMFLDSDELVNEYTKYYDLARHFNPNFKKVLMLGGAGYSYPKSFLSKYLNATMDVVEIDPMVTTLAKQYFRLKDDPRLNIFHEDGRVYLNKTEKKYDVVWGDAFSSRHSLPYQLTTKEAVQRKFDILNGDGVVVLNIISSIEGDKSKFLRAEYVTYKSIFPQVYLFPVDTIDDGNKVQNIILVASKNKKPENFHDNDPELNKYLQHLWVKPVDVNIPIITDDFAPVDYYINKTI